MVKPTPTGNEEESTTLAGPAAPEAPEVPVAEEPEAPELERPEGEPAEPGEEEPSEQEPDAEAVVADVLDRIAEFAKDEAVAERLYEKLPQELRDRHRGPEAEREELDRERAERDRRAGQTAAETEYESGVSRLQAGLQQWGDRTARNVAKAAQDAGIENPELLDGEKLAQDGFGAMQVGMNVMSTYVSRLTSGSILHSLDSHQAARHLTPDDKKALADAGGKPIDEWVAIVLPVYLDAALRAAPEHVKREERTKVENELGLLEKANKVLGVLPGDGRKATKGGQPTSKPENFEQLETLFATGQATEAQTAAYHRARKERNLD